MTNTTFQHVKHAHACAQCKSQFGISNIPCRNDPAVIEAARLAAIEAMLHLREVTP
jgi:hypothetical protein